MFEHSLILTQMAARSGLATYRGQGPYVAQREFFFKKGSAAATIPGIMGCFLSHMRLIQRLVWEGREMALVLEARPLAPFYLLPLVCPPGYPQDSHRLLWTNWNNTCTSRTMWSWPRVLKAG